MADSDGEGFENPPILPQLKYEQPEEAIEWLGRVFGFTEESRLTGQDGVLLIAALRSPLGGRVMIGSKRPGLERQPAVPDFRDADYHITVTGDNVDDH